MFDYRVMQMADSALPTGGFAYSQGLEASVVLGLVSLETLRSHLESVLEQVAGFEIPFLNDFFRGEECDQEYEAGFLAPWMLEASLAQGRSLARLWSCPPGHYLAVLARGLAAEGWGLVTVQRLYLHTVLRDQMSAAIRLGLVGPLEASRLQRELYEVAESAREQHSEEGRDRAARCSPALDLAQASHPRLYTRLFQN